jgi:hypothetical protein
MPRPISLEDHVSGTSGYRYLLFPLEKLDSLSFEFFSNETARIVGIAALCFGLHRRNQVAARFLFQSYTVVEDCQKITGRLKDEKYQEAFGELIQLVKDIAYFSLFFTSSSTVVISLTALEILSSLGIWKAVWNRDLINPLVPLLGLCGIPKINIPWIGQINGLGHYFNQAIRDFSQPLNVSRVDSIALSSALAITALTGIALVCNLKRNIQKIETETTKSINKRIAEIANLKIPGTIIHPATTLPSYQQFLELQKRLKEEENKEELEELKKSRLTAPQEASQKYCYMTVPASAAVTGYVAYQLMRARQLTRPV